MKKKLIVLLLIMLCSSIIYAQRVNVIKDAFSGKETIETSWIILNVFEKMYCSFKTDDKDNLMFELAIGFDDEATFPQGSEIQFKFDNNTDLTLRNRDQVVTTRGGAREASILLSGNGAIVRYIINKNDLDDFNSLITLVRVYYEDVNGTFYKDFEMPTGVAPAAMFKKLSPQNLDRLVQQVLVALSVRSLCRCDSWFSHNRQLFEVCDQGVFCASEIFSPFI